MCAREFQNIQGRLKIILKNEKGIVVEKRRYKNLITTKGKKWLAEYFSGKNKGLPEFYIAVGNDATPPSVNDLELIGYIERTKATVQVSDQEIDGIMRAVASFTGILPPKEGNAITLQEAGIQIKFEEQDDSNLVLYNRVIFPVINKGANMEMTLTWEVLF